MSDVSVGNSGVIVPVSVGLGAGATLIVVISIFVQFSDQTTLDIPRHDHHFQVLISGLENSYESGERIDFVMRIKGFGVACASPNIAIRDADTLEVIWYSPSAITLCDPTPKLVDVSLHQEDLSMRRMPPLYINETGTYEFKASYIHSNIVGGSFEVKAAS